MVFLCVGWLNGFEALSVPVVLRGVGVWSGLGLGIGICGLRGGWLILRVMVRGGVACFVRLRGWGFRLRVWWCLRVLVVMLY